MLSYSEDGLSPDYSLGFGLNFGGDAPVSGTVQANVSSPGACLTCGQNKFLNLSLPLILIVIAVLVLAFRK